MRERGRDQAGDVDLADPVGSLPGVQGVLLEERQGVGDGLVVGQLDLRRDLRWGDRPQGADRLHRRERQVVPAHRRGPWAGQLRDGPGQLAGVARVPSMIRAEELRGNLGADPGSVLGINGIVARVPERGVVVLDPLGDLHLEGGRLRRVDLERHPQPSRRAVVPLGQPRARQPLLAMVGERVQTEPEQQPHLLRGDLVPDRQAVDPGHAGAHPPPRRLAPIGVVRRQRGTRPASTVMSGDLPGQVRVPATGRELVQTDGHTSQRIREGPRGPTQRHPLPNRYRQCTGCAGEAVAGFGGRDVAPVSLVEVAEPRRQERARSRGWREAVGSRAGHGAGRPCGGGSVVRTKPTPRVAWL